MDRTQIIDNIKQVAKAALPPKSTLLLYGSRARGDAHKDSDWDLLILLDKPELTYQGCWPRPSRCAATAIGMAWPTASTEPNKG